VLSSLTERPQWALLGTLLSDHAQSITRAGS